MHTGPMKGLEIPDIVRHMVRARSGRVFPQKEGRSWVHGSSVSDLSSRGVENISFDLHWGEIVGVAGLVGAGRTELARVLSRTFSTPQSTAASSLTGKA